jgi:hypothetical protein
MRDGLMVSQAKMMLMNKAFSHQKELIKEPFKIPRPSPQKSGSQINEEKKETGVHSNETFSHIFHQLPNDVDSKWVAKIL